MASDFDNSWVLNLESKIFTRVKVEAKKKLNTKFPNINYTTSTNMGTPIYPTVYVHELPGVELGQDTLNETINAVNETIQIEVITDKSQKDAREIMNVIVGIMKSMFFNVNTFPSFENGTSYYRLVMRCSRTIGHGDVF